MKIHFILSLLVLSSFAQELTPLDSLFLQDSLQFGQKVALKPIQAWQRFSYSQNSLNCQFEKSCSNYMVDAILQRGVLRGAIIGTDRIVRCNPAARHYHLQRPSAFIQYDGRLVESVAWTPEAQPGKNALIATSLSIVPGLGRSFAGQPIDGLYSFLLVAGFAFNTYTHVQSENLIRAWINGSFMTLFWFADIYGAYRTAKRAPPPTHHP